MTEVRCQGTQVRLGLRLQRAAPGRSGVAVLLAEAAFRARPCAAGAAVRLSWSESDVRLLGPGAVRRAERSVPRPAPRHSDALAAMAA